MAAAVVDIDTDAAAHSLLQLGALRSRVHPPDVDAEPTPCCDLVHWCIWALSGPCWIALRKNATFSEVDQVVWYGGFDFNVSSLVPVSSGNLQLISIPAFEVHESVWALVQWPYRGSSLECLHVSDNVHSLSIRGGQGLLDFTLHGAVWLDQAQGFFHGMHLIATCRLPVAAHADRPADTQCRDGNQLPVLELSQVVSAPCPNSVSGLRLLLRSVMTP